MLVIHDPKVVQALEEIAGREQRPVDEVLKTMIERYPVPPAAATPERSAAFRRVRTKAYARARRYWETVGDHDKLALTDEALDEQFGAFDEEGIPRLKSELSSLEPPVGSMAYAAKTIREFGGVRTSGNLDPEQADEILKNEFADYLLERMKDQ